MEYKFQLKEFNKRFHDEITLSSVVDKSFQSIRIQFILEGDLTNITLPKPTQSPKRTIGLWNKTCFEFFIKGHQRQDYVEFNFSPNGDWNCLKFMMIRDGLNEWEKIEDLKVKTVRSSDKFMLEVSIDKTKLPKSMAEGDSLEVSSTAVIFNNDIETFWAIKHVDAKPNFHHPESYVKVSTTGK